MIYVGVVNLGLKGGQIESIRTAPYDTVGKRENQGKDIKKDGKNENVFHSFWWAKISK